MKPSSKNAFVTLIVGIALSACAPSQHPQADSMNASQQELPNLSPNTNSAVTGHDDSVVGHDINHTFKFKNVSAPENSGSSISLKASSTTTVSNIAQFFEITIAAFKPNGKLIKLANPTGLANEFSIHFSKEDVNDMKIDQVEFRIVSVDDSKIDDSKTPELYFNNSLIHFRSNQGTLTTGVNLWNSQKDSTTIVDLYAAQVSKVITFNHPMTIYEIDGALDKNYPLDPSDERLPYEVDPEIITTTTHQYALAFGDLLKDVVQTYVSDLSTLLVAKDNMMRIAKHPDQYKLEFESIEIVNVNSATLGNSAFYALSVSNSSVCSQEARLNFHSLLFNLSSLSEIDLITNVDCKGNINNAFDGPLSGPK